jgi:hypothetical protein
MTESDFRAARATTRAKLLERVETVLRENSALAAHLLGSLGRGRFDEFSDVDVWATFADDAIDDIVRRRGSLYAQVGPVLLCQEAPQNSPLGGIYNGVMYASAAGPHQVDFYLAPLRTSRVATDAATLFETTPIPRGAWILDVDARPTDSPSDRIDFLISMTFIGVKKLMRDDRVFLTFLANACRDVARVGQLDLDVGSIQTLQALRVATERLELYASPSQLAAIREIEAFVDRVAQSRESNRSVDATDIQETG